MSSKLISLFDLHNLSADPWIYSQALTTGNKTMLYKLPIGYIIGVINLKGHNLWVSPINVVDDYGNLVSSLESL